MAVQITPRHAPDSQSVLFDNCSKTCIFLWKIAFKCAYFCLLYIFRGGQDIFGEMGAWTDTHVTHINCFAVAKHAYTCGRSLSVH